MTKAGARIIEGLKDAIAGNFSAVTIDGQHWVRQGDSGPTIIPKGEIALTTEEGQSGLVLLLPDDMPDDEPMSRLALFLSACFVRAHDPAEATFIDEQIDWMTRRHPTDAA